MTTFHSFAWNTPGHQIAVSLWNRRKQAPTARSPPYITSSIWHVVEGESCPPSIIAPPPTPQKKFRQARKTNRPDLSYGEEGENILSHDADRCIIVVIRSRQQHGGLKKNPSLHSAVLFEVIPPSRKGHHHLATEIIGVVVATRPTRHHAELSRVCERATHVEAEHDGVDCPKKGGEFWRVIAECEWQMRMGARCGCTLRVFMLAFEKVKCSLSVLLARTHRPR